MGKLLDFLADTFWGERSEPRLVVKLEKSGASAEPDDREGKLRITWKIKLHLENQTEAPAADLKLHWPADERLFAAKLPYHLDQFEEKAVNVQVQQILPSGTAGPGDNPERLWELLPDEIQKMTLVLSYRSPRGDTFYTKYCRREGTETCEFSKTLPPNL